ncbi:flagella basal body P-ring formation protein FlgA [Parasphingorhabdus halotolerans]|uniref:Flagella basal body P-ring formation protein FlgA n=1 Tax=Parasphingorhabdus halotolerans TaxID=2725558 RepID=A0A6H2DH62_9SPHN|nr:flagella basal body P-ring formation protein FlgA [Parasphingorhabdus halotolerans]QJB68009.1 flagella basal body P-ring formation protein FlgA [Parasphingorhabdus halotolerans]
MSHYYLALPIVAVICMGAAPPFEDTASLDRQVASHLGAGVGDVGGARAAIDPKLKLKRCANPVEISETNRNALQLGCQNLGWRIFVPIRLGGNGGSQDGGSSNEPLVQRNQPVTLIIRRSNFSISYGVIAQESGAMGEYIPVRSDRKSKELMARISGPGVVEMTP